MKNGHQDEHTDDERNEHLELVLVHELHNAFCGIGPGDRSDGAADEGGKENTHELHAGKKPEHGTDQHTGGHERNPNEKDQAPEAPLVDHLTLLVGHVFHR